MATPAFSVIIPVYNGEKWLRECLASIVNQTVRVHQIIVVDDQSTDASLDIAKTFSDRIEVFTQKNGDVAGARNAGARRATGQFLLFLDQDDLWLPTYVETMQTAIASDPEADIFFCPIIRFSSRKSSRQKDKEKLSKKMNPSNQLEFLLKKNLLMPSAACVRKSTFFTLGLFNSQFKTSGDYEFWLRAALQNKKIHFIAKPLVKYRVHGSNASKNGEVMFEDQFKALALTFRNMPPSAKKKKLKRKAYSVYHEERAHWFFKNTSIAKFRREVLLSFKLRLHIPRVKTLRRLIRSVIKIEKSTFRKA